MKFSTKAIHVGQEPDPSTGAVITPLFQTSTYAQTGLGEHKGFKYARTHNPTRSALEMCLASLEAGRYALAFASGMAAETAILSLLSAGDHIIACDDLYGGSYRMFEQVLRRATIETTYVPVGSVSAYEQAIQSQTKLIWLETPSNPLLRLADIAAIVELAHRHNLLVVVDNTLASPYFQQPLTLGADIVCHSTTKYINGHDDVIGGAVVMNDPGVYEAIKFYQNAAGAVLSPFDCWLTLRGIKTLALRMRQHQENAQAVATFLSHHPHVEKVSYPGLLGHPDFTLAQAQMSGFGGMVSLQVKGDSTTIEALVRRFRVFTLAESLGGVASLVCHPASMTHSSIPRDVREARGVSETLLRLSVGIEDIEDILSDLEYALS